LSKSNRQRILYEKTKAKVILLDIVKHTHERSQLRGTSPVSYMELAASGAGNPGLALLIHLLRQ
jgi:hypothetical protein